MRRRESPILPTLIPIFSHMPSLSALERLLCSLFMTFCANSEKVTDQTPIPPPDWEALIAQVADEILAEHSPARILQVRAKLYDLLTHCIPATTILKVHSFIVTLPSGFNRC